MSSSRRTVQRIGHLLDEDRPELKRLILGDEQDEKSLESTYNPIGVMDNNGSHLMVLVILNKTFERSTFEVTGTYPEAKNSCRILGRITLHTYNSFSSPLSGKGSSRRSATCLLLHD